MLINHSGEMQLYLWEGHRHHEDPSHQVVCHCSGHTQCFEYIREVMEKHNDQNKIMFFNDNVFFGSSNMTQSRTATWFIYFSLFYCGGLFTDNSHSQVVVSVIRWLACRCNHFCCALHNWYRGCMNNAENMESEPAFQKGGWGGC